MTAVRYEFREPKILRRQTVSLMKMKEEQLSVICLTGKMA
jgi:hypothetical protein